MAEGSDMSGFGVIRPSQEGDEEGDYTTWSHPASQTSRPTTSEALSAANSCENCRRISKTRRRKLWDQCRAVNDPTTTRCNAFPDWDRPKTCCERCSRYTKNSKKSQWKNCTNPNSDDCGAVMKSFRDSCQSCQAKSRKSRKKDWERCLSFNPEDDTCGFRMEGLDSLEFPNELVEPEEDIIDEFMKDFDQKIDTDGSLKQ